MTLRECCPYTKKATNTKGPNLYTPMRNSKYPRYQKTAGTKAKILSTCKGKCMHAQTHVKKQSGKQNDSYIFLLKCYDL